MAVPLYRQYLQQARRLARLDPRRPQQGNLRRAVSSAYYALFHFLIDRSSRFLVGSAGERNRLRHLLVRAYAHGDMASLARTVRGGVLPANIIRIVGALPISDVLRRLAQLFTDVQDQRHFADYDLATSFFRDRVLDLVDDVEQNIQNWDTIRDDPATRLFLVGLLVWDKVRNK